MGMVCVVCDRLRFSGNLQYAWREGGMLAGLILSERLGPGGDCSSGRTPWKRPRHIKCQRRLYPRLVARGVDRCALTGGPNLLVLSCFVSANYIKSQLNCIFWPCEL